MNYRMTLIILSFGLLAATGFKAVSNLLEEYRHKMISDQVCRVSEARLQVGATREVVDVARSALIAAGQSEAEITLRDGKALFTEASLDPKEAQVFSCATQGRDDVQMDIYFPKLKFFDFDFVVALAASLALLLMLKVLFSILLKGLQNRFIDETDKRLASILGFSNAEQIKSPIWVEWLFKTNPKSVTEFKSRMNKLEAKVTRQSRELKTQAQEKAWREFQLTQARKFKDLAHQVRHDLRQTLGVIKSSVKTLPSERTEKSILSGAVSSLEFMIEDLKEREYKNSERTTKPLEILEVVLHEVVSEQRVYLGQDSKITIDQELLDQELNVLGIQSSALKRIFTNLVRNSIEAIGASGAVKVSATKLNSEKVLIVIEDTGHGFTDEAMKNIFKKGFTTKQNGSGLGLSFCLEKIREWNGSLCVLPNLGKTRIEIELPLAKINSSFVHPRILKDITQAIVIDDHPLEAELNSIMIEKPTIVKSLSAFEKLQAQNKITTDQTLIFDLHLEGGRKALEVLSSLPSGADYMFMTSDYLNSALLEAAEKGQFLVIPKDLIGHALESSRLLARSTTPAAADKTCPEMPALI